MPTRGGGLGELGQVGHRPNAEPAEQVGAADGEAAPVDRRSHAVARDGFELRGARERDPALPGRRHHRPRHRMLGVLLQGRGQA